MKDETKIPDRILRKLYELRPVLELQGVVQQREVGFRIRYRTESEHGYRMHRSLALGRDAAFVEAVRRLISGWREEHAAKVAAQEETTAAAEREIQARRNQQRLLMSLEGGGHERNRQLRQFFTRLETDPREALRFALTGELPARRKVGRPRKSIWGGGHSLEASAGDSVKKMFQDGNSRVAENLSHGCLTRAESDVAERSF